MFQENTMWISTDSILKERSSLNIDSKIGVANEPVGALMDVLIAHCPSFVLGRIFFPRFSPHPAIHPL